jgi:hypothetical protein
MAKDPIADLLNSKNVKSARDKATAAEKDRTTVLQKQFDASKKNQDLDKQVIILELQIAEAQTEVTDWHKAWVALEKAAGIAGTLNDAAVQAVIKDYKKKEENAKKVKDSLNVLAGQLRAQRGVQLAIQAQEAALIIKTASDAVLATPLGAYTGLPGSGALPLYYNASAVREAYFSSRSSFQAVTRKNNQITGLMQSANQPSAVSAATDLWTSSQGSKGMIVTSEQVLKAWNSGSNNPNTADAGDNHNYGFQFQYNPGTVAMTYFTSPNVDVTMMTSGQEMFNLAGVSGSQGSVSFQVIINRIFDMSYYGPDGVLKPGIEANAIYSKPPATGEFKDIYNKGTMYDVEFLLRVLMGTTMSSYLRGERTADMGWLPAMPVELHLGKSLRYLGTVNSLSLNHMIFNERMVPMLTTLDIAFARLPDYPATTDRT